VYVYGAVPLEKVTVAEALVEQAGVVVTVTLKGATVPQDCPKAAWEKTIAKNAATAARTIVWQRNNINTTKLRKITE